VSKASSSESFEAKFTVNVISKEQFARWRSQFEALTNTQFNIACTKPLKGKRVIFKQYLCCIHNVVRGELSVRKHTGCLTKMNVSIHGVQKSFRKDRVGPNISPDYPCSITLVWDHNHIIVAADVFRRHTVSSETDQKLINLYRNGHSPSTALQYIRMEIEDNLQDGHQLELALADRAICPDYQHCQYIFRTVFSKEYGNSNNNEKLTEFVDSANREFGDRCVAFEKYDSTNIIAICTPFMKRVHEHLQESGELVFVDSSGGFDRCGFRIFLFITHSRAGGM
jgi:hypothetical protein